MPASLISAQIRGIRSYSPHANSQSLEFMPLTLIVGKNGTGKTTIIESLKFIISGEEPPLSDCRRNFINTTRDGKSSKSNNFASIELEFRNTKNEICYARRQISQTGNGRNVTPSVMSSYKIADGSWIPVHKQEDWNRTMPLLFNLPNQAILDNVVLCHQEENLWCMGESSSVKQIFDKVFGCEQYKKEIKYIEMEIKSSKSDIALKEKDLIRLREKVERKKNILEDIDNSRLEMEKIESKSSKLSEEVEKVSEAKKNIISQIRLIESQSQESKRLKALESELKFRLKSSERTLKNQIIDIEKVSDTDLDKLIDQHADLVKTTKSKQQDLKSRIARLRNDIDKLESKCSNIQVRELSMITSNLGKMKSIANEMEPSDLVERLNDLVDRTDKLVKVLIKQMKLGGDISLDDSLEKLEEVDNLKASIESKRSEINSLFIEQDSMSEEMAKSYDNCEEYEKNKQIRSVMKNITDVQEKLATIGENSSELEEKLEKLQSELKKIERNEIDLRDKRSVMQGTKNQIARESSRLKSELNSLSKANIEYAECLAKIVCSNIVLSDLEKLKVCFQQSIITFHDHMIVKINEVLRSKWRQIYQGSDIDTIELVDEEVTKGKEKKINYYIAMRKNKIRMKMREKSSAGQKALASIILRMTLAELFVKDFAFIALDEPTANLDVANVQSLAKAIGSYVNRRVSKGVNIQWIIITHDEIFLEALSVKHSPYFYRTEMNEEGFSIIQKVSSLEVSRHLTQVERDDL